MERRILIADDSPEMSKLVAFVARDIYPDARIVCEWRRFTQVYRSLEPDIVVLDLAMPDIDGIDMLRFLGGCSSSASIILLSGRDQKTLDSARRFAESRDLRIVAALQKPVSIRTIEAMLRQGGERVEGANRTDRTDRANRAGAGE